MFLMALSALMTANADDHYETLAHPLPPVCDHQEQFCVYATGDEPVKVVLSDVVPNDPGSILHVIDLPAGHNAVRAASGSLCVEQKAWDKGLVELYGPVVGVNQQFNLKQVGKLYCAYTIETRQLASNR